MPFTVVIADDDPFIPTMVKTMLDRDGRFEVYAATNGKDALEYCRQFLPDVLLLDVMMPGVDGFNVCKLLKSDSATSRIRIIMLTALTQKIDLIEGYDSGADEYVTKPFTPKRLIESIDKVLGTASSRSSATSHKEPRFHRSDRVAGEDGKIATVLSRVAPDRWSKGWRYLIEYDEGGRDTIEAELLRAA